MEPAEGPSGEKFEDGHSLMEKISPVFDPEKIGRSMKVAAFMSGTGTNIVRLIELEKRLKREEGASPFEVIFIFSDRSDGSCHGEKLAYTTGIPYFSYDIRRFHISRGIKRTVATPEGLAARRAFDSVSGRLTEAFEIDVNVLGGYMSYTTLERCINVHPADLSILTSDGRRRYVGDRPVFDAISAGEEELRSSTIWTDRGIDTGPLFMVSRPLKVELPEPLKSLQKNLDRLIQVTQAHQKRLKEECDWKILPRTVELIARGRFAMDKQNRVYVDGAPVAQGYRE